MMNPASTKAPQGVSPVAAKKNWTKPTLDILELESAQHGITGLQDANIRHHSG